MARQFRPGQLQTGSLYNISSSYAVTASYAINGGGTGTNIDTGSFATTGSNVFKGNQTISGSIYLNSGSVINSTGADIIIKAGVGNNAGVALYNNNFTQYLAVDDTGSYANKLTVADKLTIAGSNGKLIYTGTTPGVGSNPTLAEVHANDDYPWLERFYNDTFSTSSAVMAYYGWNDGRFVFHNESTQSIGLQVNGFGAENGLLVYSDKVAFVNNVEVTGSLNVVGGITGSLFGTASWAENYNETDPVFTAISGSFATTGSNVFIGNQTVTGSLFTTGSNTLIGSTTLTGSLNISGSTTQIGNNTLLGNTTLSGSIIISGSKGTTNPSVRIYGDTIHDGYIRFDPVSTNIDTSISASYIYVSGSTQDLYFSQNGLGYSNVTRLRWLEGNLYTGLLHGGLITTASSTIYRISSGSGIIVNLNATIGDDPYPTIQFLEWPNLSASIAPLTASYQQAFVGIDSTNNIYAQGTPFSNGQFDSIINIGGVFFQNQSTINGVKTQPSVAYGFEQQQNTFNRAFGPLKLSGYTLAPSGSSTGSLIVASGTAYAPGSNYTVDPNESYYAVDNGTTVSKIFRYYQSGSTWVYNTNAGAGFPTIDPTQYSNNGVLTAVPGGGSNREWSIQRVFWFPNSVIKAIVVYYGNATYATELDAIANISFETFVEAPNTSANAIYLGAIVVRNNADFTDTDSYKIQPGGLFRQVGGSGGGGSIITQTLSGLSDVLISGPTNGQALVYDNTSAKWQNKSSISASISGNAATATTASYVLQAVSASYAPDTTFPYTGSALVTGSLGITGSLSVIDGNGANNLDTNVRTLYGTNSSSSINWAERKLNATNGTARLDWRLLYAIDSATSRSIDWGNRYLQDASNVTSVNWSTRLLTDASATTAVDWSSRFLYDSNSTPRKAADWRLRLLHDASTSQSLDWNNRMLTNTIGTSVVDWENQVLTDPNAITSVNWYFRWLYDSIGNISIDWESKALNDSNGTNTIYWDAYNNNYKITQYGYGETQISGVNQEEFSTIAINNASQNAAGEIINVSINIDPTVVTGDLVSLGEAGIWYQTDQTSISGSCMLGICTDPYNKGAVFTEGTITVVTASGYTDIPFVEGTSFYGKPVYMRPGVLGGLTTTIPTTGYVRVVGHLYYNNQTNTDYWLMKFRPSNDWYVI